MFKIVRQKFKLLERMSEWQKEGKTKKQKEMGCNDNLLRFSSVFIF